MSATLSSVCRLRHTTTLEETAPGLVGVIAVLIQLFIAVIRAATLTAAFTGGSLHKGVGIAP